jgi:Potential Queuosine, Q, salvage protein family
MSTQQFDVDDGYEADAMYRNPLAPAFPDQLGVLSSTRAVVELGELVWINRTSVNALQEQLLAFTKHARPPQVCEQDTVGPTWDTRYHFFDGTERTVNWLLLLDALNFCFWAENGQPRWSISYKGETLNGYWAEAAALTRAVEEGYALWDARYLSEISSADLAAIFRGAPSSGTGAVNLASKTLEIPLFEQRLANTREVGSVLLERFDGQFTRVIEEAAGSAVRLALLLAEHFPSFRDIASFRGQEVRFFKRAQICVADLRGAFGGKQWGAFTDFDQLTIFADYKLPQLLRHFGVLEYHPTLAERIDKQELLEPGSEEEVQIRATTIWACEVLRQTINAAGYEPVTAADIDLQLWLLSQDTMNMRPYHRVRTIYY